MKTERRPLLTDRIAQVIIVVVFVSLFTPLAGNVMLIPLEETGVEVFPDTPPIETGLDYNRIWIIYPLMQAAYSSIVLVPLALVAGVIVIRWVGGLVYRFSNERQWLARTVVVLLIVFGLYYAFWLAFWSLTIEETETERIVVGSDVYRVSVIAVYIPSGPIDTHFLLLKCGIGGVVCRYITTTEAEYSFDDDLAEIVYDESADALQILHLGEVIYTIPNVAADS